MSDPKSADKKSPQGADKATKKSAAELKKEGELHEDTLEGVVGGFNPQPDPPKTPSSAS